MQIRGVNPTTDDGHWRIVTGGANRGQGDAANRTPPPPCTGTCQTCGCPTCFPPGGRCNAASCRRCNPPTGPEEVWRLGQTGMSLTPGADPQHGGFRVLGNSGLRLESSHSPPSSTTGSLEAVSATSFRVNTNGTTRVMIGHSSGDQRFRPVAGERYRITFTVTGAARVRFVTNRVSSDAGPGISNDLGNATAAGTTITHTWTDTGLGHSMIEVNGAVTISNLRIERMN